MSRGPAAKKIGGRNLAYATGTAAVLLDDIQAPAGGLLPQKQLGKLTYDTKIAVPYREELLASWPAEV